MRNVLVVLIALVIAMTPIFGAGQGERVPAQKTVTVFGAFVDEEAHRFEESIRPFEEKTGIKVIYEGSKDFETLISVRVEGGNAPDIAGLPQPGLMANFAEKGKLVPVWPSLSALLDKNYAPVWRELGSYEGTTFGIFHRVNAKSFVWYPKKAWEKAGYVPPTTWDELNRLMDRMVADGLEEEARTVWPLKGLNSLNTVGLKEMFDMFEGNMERAVAIERIKKNTRVYAKKQITWFKKDPEVIHLFPEEVADFLFKHYPCERNE